MNTKEFREITWIVKGQKTKYNRGAGVGFRLDKIGRKLWYGYTASMSACRIPKKKADIIILALATGNYTGAESIKHVVY